MQYRCLDKAKYLEAHPNNFRQTTRPLSAIKYIVIHYTGNIGDTAYANAHYFSEAKISTSAHFFVSDNTIYQSVPLANAAFSVGLGSRKEPYFKWPKMWKKINNDNSVSIEMCGSKNSLEASAATKRTTAMLIADLCDVLHLTPECVYRHYDVTGKACPAWCVYDENKYIEMQQLVANEYYKEADEMRDTTENYEMFKQFMARYEKEQGEKPADWEAAAMTAAKKAGYMDGTRPKSHVTRGELATVLGRIKDV